MPGELADERAFRRGLRQATSEVAREDLMEAAEDAVRWANRVLLETTPPPEASMDSWNMEGIAESAEIYWEEGESEGALQQGDTLVIEWTHEHADKINVGVRAHEIEGDPWLAWEDRETGEMVFRMKVEHPGIPATQFIRAGFRRAIRRFM